MQHVRGCRILDQLRKERALTEVLLRVEHVGLLTLILTLTLTLALAQQATCALSMSSPPKMSPNKFISGCGRGRGRGTALIKDAHATEFSPGATVAVAGRRRMCRDFRVPSGRGRTSGPGLVESSFFLSFCHLLRMNHSSLRRGMLHTLCFSVTFCVRPSRERVELVESSYTSFKKGGSLGRKEETT